ncbi:EAL domain, c-di-GMP-specific phosphodiesterase class I (or its enzymatically inactive variant) [Geodermatophilus dictyosporus]|uniref:EAL domain, c-di-GMP-specific phosphodiesterase class I (Or its enzymatically inactive variant) n=1 Tax=Geodermatophilus dictyosporus TaxID=1523247 RepID=A0A1I5SKV1_9ACTN|nr:EAL domain-containing protein [Geodermatophilus dictyosporus]SFP71271.1 EAL domain, c-di-GMP-specific phosphodiesterase class I (or its enzymatically inactive variant) [Geodermatophilus dictyosporus]
MLLECSEAARQVERLLRTARSKLDLSVAFLSRIDDTARTVQVADSAVPEFRAGYSGPRDSGFCLAVVEGRLPRVIPDVRRVPEAVRLHPGDLPQIRAHVSAPVVLSDGAVYGTFCAFGLATDPEVSPRDQALVEVLADAAALVIEPEVRRAQRQAEINDRLASVVAGGGPQVLLQPIVDVRTGARVGAEALSRFPAEWGRAPDVVFEEAHSVGEGDRLELLALARAAALLDRVSGYVSMNVSPQTLLTPACGDLLARLPLHRVVLELSEHDPVEDYTALDAALAPLRAAGMRLAIDDVGAGFSSLRHIVVTAPDVLKMDRSIVSGVDADPVLARLARSLVDFAHGVGVVVVAEGVETPAEHAVLRSLGVDDGQGWLFGRPAPADALADAGTVLTAASLAS